MWVTQEKDQKIVSPESGISIWPIAVVWGTIIWQTYTKTAVRYKLLNQIKTYYKYQPHDMKNNNLYWSRAVITEQLWPNDQTYWCMIRKQGMHGWFSIPIKQQCPKSYAGKINKHGNFAKEIEVV